MKAKVPPGLLKAGSILLAVILLILLNWLWQLGSEKNHLSKAWSQIKLPGRDKLTYIYWNPESVDSQPNWSYTYSSANPDQDVVVIKQEARQAGYTITNSANFTGQFVAINKSKDVEIRFGNGKFDSNSLTHIEVQVFRASSAGGDSP